MVGFQIHQVVFQAMTFTKKKYLNIGQRAMIRIPGVTTVITLLSSHRSRTTWHLVMEVFSGSVRNLYFVSDIFLSLCPTDLNTKYQTFLCQIIECQESTDCLDYLNTGQIFKWPFKYWASFSGFFYNGDPNNGNFQIRDFSQFVN